MARYKTFTSPGDVYPVDLNGIQDWLDGRVAVLESAGLSERLPTSGEKAALAGTSGAPGDLNRYVTAGDAAYAKVASPALTGTPTAPTAASSDNSTKIATTAFVKGQAYATLASPALTGTPTAPTAASSDNSTKIATTAFVKGQIAGRGKERPFTKASTAAWASADGDEVGSWVVVFPPGTTTGQLTKVYLRLASGASTTFRIERWDATLNAGAGGWATVGTFTETNLAPTARNDAAPYDGADVALIDGATYRLLCVAKGTGKGGLVEVCETYS